MLRSTKNRRRLRREAGLPTVARWHRNARASFLIFVIVTLVAGLNGGALLFMNSMGWQVWGNQPINTQGDILGNNVLNIDSAKIPVSPVVTPASRLALTFKNFTPDGWNKVGNTQFGTDQPLSLLCPSYNDIYPVSSDRATFQNGANSEGNITLQIYPAGLGSKVFTDQKAAVGRCGGENGSVYLAPSNLDLGVSSFAVTVNDTSGSRYQLHAWLDGDVIVYVASTSTQALEALAGGVNRLIDIGLASSCVHRAYPWGDFTRNPWGPKYAEYYEEITIRVPPAENLLSIVTPTSLGIEIPIVPEIVIPDRPSKTLWPKNLPTPVKAPRQLIDPGFIPETGKVSRVLLDAEGPGCGWTFTGLKQPPFDGVIANDNFFSAIQSSKTVVKEKQEVWAESVALFWKRYDPFVKKMSLYEQYAQEITVIGAYWDVIQQERDVYKIALADFREQARNRKQFIEDQNTARVKYETEVAWCLANPDPFLVPVPIQPEFDELGNLVPPVAVVVTPAIACPALIPTILNQPVPVLPLKPVSPTDPVPPDLTLFNDTTTNPIVTS